MQKYYKDIQDNYILGWVHKNVWESKFEKETT